MAKHTSHDQSCGELQPAVCLSRGYVAIWRPPEHLWTSDKSEKQATAKAAEVYNFQHRYLPELLVNVYSYCLTMKSVSWCCVRGRWLFSNLVIFMVVSYEGITAGGPFYVVYYNESFQIYGIMIANRSDNRFQLL